MKLIDYDETKGSFKIEYLDDHEIVSGTINMDKDSLSMNALITKQIINNKENDIIEIRDNNIIRFKILEKKIELKYKEVNEYDFFESFKTYNEVVLGIESDYSNISDNINSSNNVIYQFYYKNDESDEKGTASYMLKNYFKKGWKTSDIVSPEGYYKEFDILCRSFKSNFLAKKDANINDYYYCSVPKDNELENANLDGLVYEITKRDISHNVNGYFKNNNKELIKNRDIILIDDIQFNADIIKKYKKQLISDGAKSVIMYTFAKSSIVLRGDISEL